MNKSEDAKFQLVEDVRESLESVINTYYEANQIFSEAKQNRDLYNSAVKELLNNNNLKSYLTDDGCKASLSVTEKVTFDEEKMIEYLKPFNIPGLIKTKEYVDMDVLEDALYHNNIDAEKLAPFRKVSTTETLRVSKVKPLHS